MRISVIIPSRLAPNPLAEGGRLFVERAVASVRRQTVFAAHEFIIHVVTDLLHDGLLDKRIARFVDGPVVASMSVGAGQAMAMNLGADKSLTYFKADVLAFLEDDDTWHEKKLEYQLAALEQGFDFVSCNQRETDIEGSYIRVNDFPTTSGWLMPAETWKTVGPFDETFRWHLDTEWLGRLSSVGKRRLHMVESGSADNPRPWLRNVMRFSKAATTEEREPLVNRTVNPKGGMARIASDPKAGAESREEHRIMAERFGSYPW